MPVYKYKAIDGDGKIFENTITATSKEEVMQNLHSKNQMPLFIQVNDTLQSRISRVRLQKVKTKDIAVFCRQFYTMNKAGVPIITCLDTIRQQTGNKQMQAALDEVYTQLSGGVSFSEALKSHADVFPDLLVSMAESGDATGNLDTVMLRMAVHYEKENKINAKIKGAMVYPVVLAVLALGVTAFLLTFVMPTFVSLFEESGVLLPLPTRILLGLSDWMVNYWYVLFGAVALVVVLVRWFVVTPTGSVWFDSMRLRMPLFGDLNMKIITSRFSRTMATLLASGIPLISALEIVSRIADNKVIERGLLNTADSVSKGSDLAVPIRAIGHFPPMLNAMVRIGEQSGTLDELLDQTANFYDDEVETAIQAMLTILEPLLIVVMAVVLGGMIIAIILPMFDMFAAFEQMAN